MSSPCPSWPFPVSRTTIETLVNPLEVSRANGSSSQCSIQRGNSATREYVASVPLAAGWPSPGGTAISERRDTEPQTIFGVTPIPPAEGASLPAGHRSALAPLAPESSSRASGTPRAFRLSGLPPARLALLALAGVDWISLSSVSARCRGHPGSRPNVRGERRELLQRWRTFSEIPRSHRNVAFTYFGDPRSTSRS